MTRWRLPSDYEAAYLELLGRVAATPRIRPRELALFWPKVGRAYTGDLMIIGRAVNGWIDRWDLDQPADLPGLAATARATGEGTVDGDQLGCVIARWGARDGGYDTASSQFWTATREVTLGGRDQRDDWPSLLTWTNLAKLAPWGRRNPGGTLLRIQRELGPALLRREVALLAPRRVLVLTGGWWFGPFADALGLHVDWREGLVEGVADEPGRRWVIAVHPMTRSPHAVAQAALSAFGSSS
jgi:hypothetical protein